MTSASDQTQIGFIDRFRQARRKRIKRHGKKTIRRLADFLGKQSKVGDVPVHDMEQFPHLQSFADNWETIRDEVREILKHREAVPVFQEVSIDQMKIAKGNNWRTFILFGFGNKAKKNCEKAPVTTSLLEQVPNLQTAWFSILGPGYHIPAHRGVTKGILRAHLGLLIPKQQEKCRMRVGPEICVWRPGEIFVFDDTYEHEVWNDTDEERVILLFDFDRPMRFWGRVLNKTFVTLLKFSAYYQEPAKKLQSFEDRFEAAIRRADENLEKMSEPGD